MRFLFAMTDNEHDVTIEQAIQTAGQQLLLLPRPPGERVGQGGQVLQRGVRVCPGERDRVGTGQVLQ